jgi:predicted metal-dependent HD superfamily phosphohydrolase
MTFERPEAVPISSLTLLLDLVPEDLRVVWDLDVGSPADSAERLAGLVSRHSEPNRCYHALSHVLHLLNHLPVVLDAEGVDPASQVARTLRLALWYHDAIYDVHSSSNEADSAVLANRELDEMGLAHSLCTDVSRLVMATKHPCLPQSLDEAIIVDVDLGILASSDETYDRYVCEVREEYSYVSDNDWRIGRSRVLNGFLDVDNIFHTTIGKTWEPKARENLRRELHSLTQDRSDSST